MQQYQLTQVAGLTADEVADKFEDCCDKLGLAARRVSLKKFPGGMHWHVTKPSQNGTLEATLANGRLWLSIHDNRRAQWQARAIEDLRSAMSR